MMQISVQSTSAPALSLAYNKLDIPVDEMYSNGGQNGDMNMELSYPRIPIPIQLSSAEVDNFNDGQSFPQALKKPRGDNVLVGGAAIVSSWQAAAQKHALKQQQQQHQHQHQQQQQKNSMGQEDFEIEERISPFDSNYSQMSGKDEEDGKLGKRKPNSLGTPMDMGKGGEESAEGSGELLRADGNNFPNQGNREEVDAIFHRMTMELSRENSTLKMQLENSRAKVQELSFQLSTAHAALRELQGNERQRGPAPDLSMPASDWWTYSQEGDASWRQAYIMPVDGALRPPAGGADFSATGELDVRNFLRAQPHQPSQLNEFSVRTADVPGAIDLSALPYTDCTNPSGFGDMQGISRVSSTSSLGMQSNSSGHGKQMQSPKSQESGHNRSRFWTEQEHERFLEAMKIFGYGNAQDIASYVGTRSVTQVRTHAQKYFMKLCKGAVPNENS
uniref:HTH myb-type domain-containing protein n=1 Tax=Hanusia phi TaxID=3032 RepID=A0A7S0EFL9_9CRYP|mmetsp:Transcript_23562/g.52941  ORF Transcript_23562/g.52941 Transcript_23562/m.52941 type:complete len:446 (+) Transcript_23562:58-1395(+)